MNADVMLILSKLVFGGSICLIVYLVYREFLITRMKAERDEIELGEKINEGTVGKLSDTDLVDLLNKESSSKPGDPKKS